MDAFYASVEQRDDPNLRGKPIAVGGSTSGRGVVSAASYEARVFGVRSAMPAGQALKLCPNLIFVKANFDKYKEASTHMRNILRDYTDIIESASLDECYLDVTGYEGELPTATAIAEEIRARIWQDLRLTASAGVAPYKYVAKIASDYRKPDGLTVVHPSKVLAFLHPLPINRIPGVGPATHKRLLKEDVETIGDLALWPQEKAIKIFGKHGRRLWEKANGIDNRPVSPFRVRKSRSAERTFFDNLQSRSEMVKALKYLAERVCSGLERDELLARNITLKVRWADFTTVTRSTTLHLPTADESLVLSIAEALLDTVGTERPIRLLGIRLARFVRADEPHQMFFPF